MTQPIDFNGLDTTVHGPVRLGVLVSLRVDGPLDFTTLKTRMDASDGVIGLHLRKLEEAGYINCKKRFIGRRPKSTYRMTAKGERALMAYINNMRKVLDALE